MKKTVKLEGGEGMSSHLAYLQSNNMVHADVKIMTTDKSTILAHSVSKSLEWFHNQKFVFNCQDVQEVLFITNMQMRLFW